MLKLRIKFFTKKDRVACNQLDGDLFMASRPLLGQNGPLSALPINLTSPSLLGAELSAG